jgi:hypothetical protein
MERWSELLEWHRECTRIGAALGLPMMMLTAEV